MLLTYTLSVPATKVSFDLQTEQTNKQYKTRSSDPFPDHVCVRPIHVIPCFIRLLQDIVALSTLSDLRNLNYLSRLQNIIYWFHLTKTLARPRLLVLPLQQSIFCIIENRVKSNQRTGLLDLCIINYNTSKLLSCDHCQPLDTLGSCPDWTFKVWWIFWSRWHWSQGLSCYIDQKGGKVVWWCHWPNRANSEVIRSWCLKNTRTRYWKAWVTQYAQTNQRNCYFAIEQR